jgi:hypothetical protein
MIGSAAYIIGAGLIIWNYALLKNQQKIILKNIAEIQRKISEIEKLYCEDIEMPKEVENFMFKFIHSRSE